MLIYRKLYLSQYKNKLYSSWYKKKLYLSWYKNNDNKSAFIAVIKDVKVETKISKI